MGKEFVSDINDVPPEEIAEAVQGYFVDNPIDGDEIEWEGAPSPLLTYQNSKV